jgi:hypothetical protein
MCTPGAAGFGAKRLSLEFDLVATPVPVVGLVALLLAVFWSDA